MDFVAILIIFPAVIGILSLVCVYYFGVIGVLASSVIISFYYTFALDGVRGWNPNGIIRKTPMKRVIKNFMFSITLSLAVLFVFHYSMNYFFK